MVSSILSSWGTHEMDCRVVTSMYKVWLCYHIPNVCRRWQALHTHRELTVEETCAETLWQLSS